MPVRSGEIQSLLGRQQNWKSSSALPLVGGSAEAPLEVPVLLKRAQIRPRGRLRAAVGEIWGSLRCEPFPGLLPARSLELCGCFWAGCGQADFIQSPAQSHRRGLPMPASPPSGAAPLLAGKTARGAPHKPPLAVGSGVTRQEALRMLPALLRLLHLRQEEKENGFPAIASRNGAGGGGGDVSGVNLQ